MRDPIIGEVGIFMLILGLGLYILFYDHFDNNGNNGGFAV